MKVDIKLPELEKIIPKKKPQNDWWIWFISTIFALGGLTLIILFSILLKNSYCNGQTNVAAYAGAIGAGLAAMIAALTQIIVFVHKMHDEKQKRLEKAEHDYTNFFIKNYEWNELVLLNLESVINKLQITYQVDKEKNIIEFSFPNTYVGVPNLRQIFIVNLIQDIDKDSELGDMLIDKYKLKRLSTSTFYSKLFSCIDTEIKKTLNSFEKILLNFHNDKYDKDYYFNKIKTVTPRFLKAIFPYIVLVLIGNNTNSNVDNYPYIIYSIVKER